MPYPIEMMTKLHDAGELVRKGELAEAAHIVESIYAWAEQMWDAFNDTEAMHFLGYLASVLRALQQSDRESRVLERLCVLALNDLERLGILATDDDIRRTGMDFIHLGLAYRKAGRLRDAEIAFEKGREVLEELGWLVEVQKLVNGETTTVGPSPLVQKRPYQPKPGEHEKLFRQFEANSAHLKQMLQGDSGLGAFAGIAVGKQVAKLMLMDSIITETPTEPYNPLECRTAEGQPLDWLGQILEIHRKDCDEAHEDIPLTLGVPADFIKAVEAYLQAMKVGGLKPEKVRIIPEPEAPFVQPNGSFVMQDKYRMKTYLLGGGACLAQVVESGHLSELWKSGIRWLQISQLANLGARIDSNSLNRLPSCGSAGLFEVVERQIMADSKLVQLQQNGRPICIDDRRLRSPELQKLRSSPYVGTGTFWIRCERLAEVFGIKRELLDAEWNQAEWEGKLTKQLFKAHAILTTNKEMGFAMTIPVWEAFPTLELEVRHVTAERIRLVLLGAPSP